jgi:hypothetical protein
VPADVAAGSSPLRQEHVWYLLEPSTKALVTAWEDPRFATTVSSAGGGGGGGLRELPLPRAVQLWGLEPPELAPLLSPVPPVPPAPPSEWRTVSYRGRPVRLPRVPAKYLRFLRARHGALREARAMAAVGAHAHVLGLHGVLEQVTDTKATLFLVLELAGGGELFDFITAQHRRHHHRSHGWRGPRQQQLGGGGGSGSGGHGGVDDDMDAVTREFGEFGVDDDGGGGHGMGALEPAVVSDDGVNEIAAGDGAASTAAAAAAVAQPSNRRRRRAPSSSQPPSL